MFAKQTDGPATTLQSAPDEYEVTVISKGDILTKCRIFWEKNFALDQLYKAHKQAKSRNLHKHVLKKEDEYSDIIIGVLEEVPNIVASSYEEVVARLRILERHYLADVPPKGFRDACNLSDLSDVRIYDLVEATIRDIELLSRAEKKGT